MKKRKARSLRTFNIVVGLLHLVQGVVMLLMSSDFSLPVTSAFVTYSPAAGKLIPVLEQQFTLALGPLVAGFLFLSAAAHIAVSLPGINEWYIKNIKNRMNPARWIEYAFSSSLMIVVVAMLSGIYDGISLLLLFGVNAMMILFGWMMELHNQTTKRTNWTSYIFGCIAGVLPWVAIAIALFGAGGPSGDVPAFVYWIFLSIFIFFNIFAVNMILQYKRVGKWRDYLYGERAYIILSLVAKTLLAWQVWGGTLRPV